MKENNENHQDKDRFIIRLDDGMRDRIKGIASQNRRSMNAQFVDLLSRGLESLEGQKQEVAQPVYIQNEQNTSEADRFIGAISELIVKLTEHEKEAMKAHSALEAKLDVNSLIKIQALTAHNLPSEVGSIANSKVKRLARSLECLENHIQEVIKMKRLLQPFDVSNTMRWSKSDAVKFPTKSVDLLLYRKLIEDIEANINEFPALISKAEKIVENNINSILYSDIFEEKDEPSIEKANPSIDRLMHPVSFNDTFVSALMSDLAKQVPGLNQNKADPGVGLSKPQVSQPQKNRMFRQKM